MYSAKANKEEMLFDRMNRALKSATMQPVGEVSIRVELSGSLNIPIQQNEPLKTRKFQKLTERFLEDCKLHEIVLTPEIFQLLSEAYFVDANRSNNCPDKKLLQPRMRCKQFECKIEVYPTVFDLM